MAILCFSSLTSGCRRPLLLGPFTPSKLNSCLFKIFISKDFYWTEFQLQSFFNIVAFLKFERNLFIFLSPTRLKTVMAAFNHIFAKIFLNLFFGNQRKVILFVLPLLFDVSLNCSIFGFTLVNSAAHNLYTFNKTMTDNSQNYYLKINNKKNKQE